MNCPKNLASITTCLVLTLTACETEEAPDTEADGLELKQALDKATSQRGIRISAKGALKFDGAPVRRPVSVPSVGPSWEEIARRLGTPEIGESFPTFDAPPHGHQEPFTLQFSPEENDFGRLGSIDFLDTCDTGIPPTTSETSTTLSILDVDPETQTFIFHVPFETFPDLYYSCQYEGPLWSCAIDDEVIDYSNIVVPPGFPPHDATVTRGERVEGLFIGASPSFVYMAFSSFVECEGPDCDGEFIEQVWGSVVKQMPCQRESAILWGLTP